jgi:triosephosphate isomerase
MLRELGCSHVIVGHSERRQFFGDSDQRVALKVSRVVAAGLIPIICVGETLLERQDSMTEKVIERQVAAALSQIHDKAKLSMIVAYEPVWAIGTGESASPEQAQKVHLLIRDFLSEYDVVLSESTRILYGGSVKPDNAASLFAMPDIDGGLVGGASLDAKSFINICRSTA